MDDLSQITSNTSIALAAVFGQIIVFATLVWNSRQQRLTAEQNRRWEIEDRAILAAKVAADTQAVADKVVGTSDALAARVMQTSLELAQKVLDTSAALEVKVQASSDAIAAAIAENTVKTEGATLAAKEAYQEANHVNLKISDLNARLLQQEQDRAAKDGKRPN